jgi:hypothetical protein
MGVINRTGFVHNKLFYDKVWILKLERMKFSFLLAIFLFFSGCRTTSLGIQANDPNPWNIPVVTSNSLVRFGLTPAGLNLAVMSTIENAEIEIEESSIFVSGKSSFKPFKITSFIISEPERIERQFNIENLGICQKTSIYLRSSELSKKLSSYGYNKPINAGLLIKVNGELVTLKYSGKTVKFYNKLINVGK